MKSNNAIRLPFLPLIIDLLLLLVFILIGRANHKEVASLRGTFEALMPFAWGLSLGYYTCTTVIKLPFAWLKPGIEIWFFTVAIGIAGRRFIFHDTTPTSFILVAFGFNFLTLIGWRMVHRYVTPVVAQRMGRA